MLIIRFSRLRCYSVKRFHAFSTSKWFGSPMSIQEGLVRAKDMRREFMYVFVPVTLQVFDKIVGLSPGRFFISLSVLREGVQRWS